MLAEAAIMTARFTLSGIWLSGPTYKVALMLALSGEPFHYTHLNLRAGEHKQPGYRARQRFGQVPLLEDAQNGRCLSQAAAILEYLADMTNRFGGATLDERLAIREWLYWDYDRLTPGVYRSRGVKLGFRSVSQAVAEAWYEEGCAGLQVLEEHLAGREWMTGEMPGIADIDIYGVVHYAPAGGFRMHDYPAVSAWAQRMRALPGFGDPEELLPRESRVAA